MKSGELVTHTGTLGGKPISVVSTGMGTDNIDIVFNELDALFNIDFGTRTIKKDLTSLKIIRLGTSGTIQPDIKLGSIIASEYAVGYDGLLGYYELPIHKLSHIDVPDLGDSKGYIVSGSTYLLNTIAQDYQRGITYTAAGFYAPQGRQLRAKVTIPNLIEQLQEISFPDNRKITNIEMETAGIYGLGSTLGHEVISISVILADRVNEVFHAQPDQAIQKMLEDCLEKITHI